jgi:exonuclease SbcC
MRFAHLADTHIRNLKYHKEYRVVFDRLYKKLAKQKPDYIIHCGDIAHTKTQISPEFVQMCSDFFRNLADIAPTYVILGNHDGNLRNSSRQDALTPIVNALEHPSLHLLRDSGEVALKGNFSLNVLSVFDEGNWQAPSDNTRINIALYHGSISNCQTDAGWTMERGENDLSIFNNFDYGFLGDIHKTNQALDKLGKVRYPGSTIQQNHGETNDKGYLLWDVKGKNKFTVKHCAIKNPKPFITVVLTPSGRIPKNTEVQKGARLRLVSENNLSLSIVRKAVEASKVRFKPEAITYVNRSAGERGNVEELTNGLVQEDLRDVAIQEELIDEYLKDFQATDVSLEKVYQLNRKYKAIAEEQEEVSRNVNWKIKHLEWDNLFNYAEDNNINFANMNGIVGILGKNFSGKSSIIDSLLYAMYNTTSKHNRKNLNIINQNKEDCRGYVEIDVGTRTYMIERVSKKYQKKLKGKVTTEAKTDVDFRVLDNATGEEKELNGLSRIDTDKNIRKIFGTIDDFLLTSMASQLGSLNYINEGSTKRKEILAKFLDLEIFENKFRKAKEDASDMRAALRRSEEREFDSELKKARTEFARNDTLILTKERECQNIQKNTQNMLDEFSGIDAKIRSLPTEIINICEVNNELTKQKEMLTSHEKENKSSSKDLQESKKMLGKLTNFLEAFDVSSLEEKQKLIEKNYDKLDKIEKEINKHEDQLERQKKKIQLLNEVPCGSEFSHCKFIKDAYSAKEKINGTLIAVEELSVSKKAKQASIIGMEPNKTNDYITKYEQVIEKKSSTQNEINSLELSIEKNKTKMLKCNNAINILEGKKEQYEENKEAIENLESLLDRKKELEKLISIQKEMFQVCQKNILDLYKVNGSLEQQLNNIDQEHREYKDMQEQYSAYDLFMRCMHSNGIAFDIIKKRLPLINSEVSKILTNIVDFEIMFVNEDTKLDILIKHPEYDARPIEMGSGAEKTIAAMAIRLALLNISTLPKGDVFILDEPGTALDEENMEGFIRILDMIKTQFKTVLLISHLDSLKDIVDTQVMIDKKEGFANVNH